MLPGKPEVYSHCPEEDWRYGIPGIAGVFRSRPGAVEERLCSGDYYVRTRPNDVQALTRRGIRTVLLCPRVGRLTGQRLAQISGYETVAVSEDRSYALLKNAGISNLVLMPEPVFLVQRQYRPMEDGADTVALCLSNPREAEGILYRNYCHLIRCILRDTPMKILLLPYCIQPSRNDFLLCRVLYGKFRDSGRVTLREDGDSRQLQGDLERCRLCIGNAGAVAAWGCGVPGLCLCATSRTLGLAQTLLGSWQEGVVPWQTLKADDDLTRRFWELLKKEDRHRTALAQNRHILC